MNSSAEGNVSKSPQSEEAGDISGITKKPWGSEQLLYLGEYAAKILRIDAGKMTSLHYHEEKEETIFVHSGTLMIEFAERRHTMTPGNVIQVPYQTRHRLIALEEDVVLFEASTPHLADVVRIEDIYGRIG